jgi:hypothetical protein
MYRLGDNYTNISGRSMMIIEMDILGIVLQFHDAYPPYTKCRRVMYVSPRG